MTRVVETEPVPACPVCGGNALGNLYRSVVQTGSMYGAAEVTIQLCGTCGFAFQNPRPTLAALATYYRESAESSGSTFHSDSPDGRHHQKTADRFEYFIKHLSSRAGRLKVLEVGCSTGDFLGRFDKSADLMGIEPSTTAVEAAKSFDVRILGAFYQDVKLPVEDAPDVIVALSVIEHLPDPKNFLRWAIEQGHSETQLWMEMPNTLFPAASLVEYFGFEHLLHFTPQTLRRALEDVGWGVVEMVDGAPGLRVIAAPATSTKGAFTETKSDLRKVVERYTKTMKEIRQRFDRFASACLERTSRGQRIGLFGMGVHGVTFLEMYPRLAQEIAVFVDSNPEKWSRRYKGRPIRPPSELTEFGVDACIVSSGKFSAEMSRAVEVESARHGKPIEVLNPYLDG